MKKSQSPRSQARSRGSHQAPEPRLPRILVVEDDQDLRPMITEALEQCGYRVDDAANGALGWSALNARHYDLVVTDNSMPVLSGVELLKKMRSARVMVPVIMASGTMPWSDFTNSLWLQPAATLVKPYTFRELFDAVTTVLRAAPAQAPTAAPRMACPKKHAPHRRVVHRKSAAAISPVQRTKANRGHAPVKAFAS
jgi:DNA-binding response OmpR family regulator